MSEKQQTFISSTDADDPQPELQGGLIVKKSNGPQHVFRAPLPKQALGLQKLADDLRAEKAREKLEKTNTADDLSRNYNAGDNSNKREYRQRRDDTPSNPGGLSQEARDRLNSRRNDQGKYREGGLYMKQPEKRRMEDDGGNYTPRRRPEWDQTPGRGAGSSTPRTGVMPRTGSVRRLGGVGNWQETPRVGSTGYDDTIQVPDGVDTDRYKEDQNQLDREWYNLEESGANEEERFDDYNGYYKKKEEEFKQKTTVLCY